MVRNGAMSFTRFVQDKWSEYLKLKAASEDAATVIEIKKVPQSYRAYNDLLFVMRDWREPGPEDAKLASLLRHIKANGREDLTPTVKSAHVDYRISQTK
jgi:hypothetical protein